MTKPATKDGMLFLAVLTGVIAKAGLSNGVEGTLAIVDNFIKEMKEV